MPDRFTSGERRCGRGPASARNYVGKPVVFGLRPDALTDFSDAEAMLRPHGVRIDVEVDVLEPTGAEALTYVTLGGTTAIARVNARRAVDVGETASLLADMSHARLFDPDSEQAIG